MRIYTKTWQFENITKNKHFVTIFDFFLKMRFLSDCVVPACPKYISGKLRSFSKSFSKIIFIPHFLKIFFPMAKVLLLQKISPPRGWEHPKIAYEPKNRFLSKSEISSPQSNHGKRNIKLMLVQP